MSCLVTRNEGMARAIELAGLYAQTDATVVLIGESGTGKYHFARMIHDGSRRADGPFIDSNLAGMEDSISGSELFGHEKGAFTDAKVRRHGLLQSAHRGSLLLDEIARASPAIQRKLIPLLDGRGNRPVGGDRNVPVDVRFIIGTNVHPHELKERGDLIPDVYYRLGMCYVILPPLRERREDIGMFADHFIRQLAPGIGYDSGKLPRLDRALLRILEEEQWESNVRGLRSAIEQILIHAQRAPVLIPEFWNPEPLTGSGTLPLRFSNHAERLAYVRKRAWEGAGSAQVGKEVGRKKSTIHNMAGDIYAEQRRENNRRRGP